MAYLDVPITTDAQQLLDVAVASLQAAGWTAHDGDPEVVLLETIAPLAQNAAEVAAQVPASIFQRIGSDLFDLAYAAGSPATAITTWTLADSAGHAIPAGTAISIDGVFFATVEDVTVTAGSFSATGVAVRALQDGTAGNGLTGTAQPVNPLAWLNAITVTGSTGGGADAEDDDAYRSRLRAEATLLGPRPITASDYSVFARNVPNVTVGRSTAIDGYNPADGTSNNPRMVTVVVTGSDGLALLSGDRAAIAAYLQARREANFIVNVVSATYTDGTALPIVCTVKAYAGYDQTVLAAAVKTAVAGFLDPLTWGAPAAQNYTSWTNERVVRRNKLIGVIERVDGVDYVDTLTLNGAAGDYTMTGALPLPNVAASSVTVTVT